MDEEVSIYDPESKQGFKDPVVRCSTCSKIINMEALHRLAACPYCGNRRVAALRGFNSEELEKMKEWGIDPEFIKMFEGVSDEGT